MKEDGLNPNVGLFPMHFTSKAQFNVNKVKNIFIFRSYTITFVCVYFKILVD